MSQTEQRTVILLLTAETHKDERLTKQYARITAELEGVGFRVSNELFSNCNPGAPSEALDLSEEPARPSAAICLTNDEGAYTAYIAVHTDVRQQPDDYSISTPLGEQEARDPLALKIAELLHGALIQLSAPSKNRTSKEPPPKSFPQAPPLEKETLKELPPQKEPPLQPPSTTEEERMLFFAGVGMGANHTYSGLNTFWGLFVNAGWQPMEKVVVGAEAFFPVLEAPVSKDGLEASVYATVVSLRILLSLRLNSHVFVLPGISAGALWARVDGAANEQMIASNDKATVFVLGLPVCADLVLSKILKLRAQWSALLLERDIPVLFGEDKAASFGRVTVQWSLQAVFLF